MIDRNPADMRQDGMMTNEIPTDVDMVITHKTRDTARGRLDLTTFTTRLDQTTIVTRSRTTRLLHSTSSLVEETTESSFETDNTTGELISVATREYTVTTKLDPTNGTELVVTYDPPVYPEYRAVPKKNVDRIRADKLNAWKRAHNSKVRHFKGVGPDVRVEIDNNWRNGQYNPMNAMDPCKESRHRISRGVMILTAFSRYTSPVVKLHVN